MNVSHLIAATMAIVLLLAYPVVRAQAGKSDESCSCKNLESLQQELENALYEAKFFAELSRKLKEIEQRQIEINKDPAHPDSGLSVLAVSGEARKKIMATEFRPPHPQVKDYTGPQSVDMEPLSCTQKPADLEALKIGSPCKEIADIVLEHEAQHRAKCVKDTPGKYWSRLPSELAAEEAERYEAQAKAMREQLKRVIDEGRVTVSAEMVPRVFGPEFDVTYSYVTDPMEMKGKSSPGADEWTLKGEGSQAGTIKRVKIAGMTCKPSGQLNDAVKMTLNTDGLWMSLDEEKKARPGDVKIECKGGFGMSMRPMSDSGGGRLFDKERVKTEGGIEQEVKTLDVAKYLRQGGMSVSGTHKVEVQLICPGE